MRSLLVASIVILAAHAANAADISFPVKAPPPAEPAYGWTGFYVGLNAGGFWSRDPVTSALDCPIAGTCVYNLPANVAVINAAGTGTLTDSGFTGGAQVGYNWQTGRLVLGAEADIESFRVSSARVVTSTLPAAVTTVTVGTSANTNWLATFRGRLGWAVVPNVLLFATGGLALTDGKLSNSFSDNFAVAVFGPANTVGASSTSGTWAGYAVGGGAEWALNRNWSFKGEYLYVNFGSRTTTATVGGPVGFNNNTLTTSGTLSANIGRVGVNFRF